MPIFRGALFVASASGLRQHAEPSEEPLPIPSNAVAGLKDWYEYSYMKALNHWTTSENRPGPRPYYLKAPGGPIDMDTVSAPWPVYANVNQGPVLPVEPVVHPLPPAPQVFLQQGPALAEAAAEEVAPVEAAPATEEVAEPDAVQETAAPEAEVEWTPMYIFISSLMLETFVKFCCYLDPLHGSYYHDLFIRIL